MIPSQPPPLGPLKWCYAKVQREGPSANILYGLLAQCTMPLQNYEVL